MELHSFTSILTRQAREKELAEEAGAKVEVTQLPSGHDQYIDVSCRSMLQAELLDRCGRNRHYSSRAFARDLSLSPSYLTQLMNGNRKISERLASEITAKIDWPERKNTLFMTLAQRQNARTVLLQRKYDEIIAQLKVMDEDFFAIDLQHDNVISDWRHGAILEMMEFSFFQSDSRWIARKLGMSLAAAEMAVERMVAIGIIHRDENGELSKPFKHSTTPPVAAKCIRKKHQGLLQEAGKALESQPSEQRDYSSIIMAIDPKRMEEAKKRIERFRRELMVFLESGERKELYALSLQLFRLDRSLAEDATESFDEFTKLSDQPSQISE